MVRDQYVFFNRLVLCILLLVMMVFNNHLIFAQNYCTQTLKRAQLAYDEGRISEVPGMVEECLKNGFNRDEKAIAYRLLTLTYLYLDEPALADESMLRLLELNHEYKVNPSVDPSELINLYNSFRTNAIFRIGLKGGINWMYIPVTQTYSSNGDRDEKVKIKSNVGFQIGIAGEVPLNKHFEVCPELLFSVKEFKYDYQTAGEYANYSEKLNLISLPLLLKYSIGSRNYIPFVNAGFEVNYLMSSIGNTGGDIVSPSVDVTKQRTRVGYSLVFGTGIKSKFGPGILSLGLRFFYGLNGQVVDKERYHNNATYTLNYGLVASQFRINTCNVNMSYSIPIYKPKKVR